MLAPVRETLQQTGRSHTEGGDFLPMSKLVVLVEDEVNIAEIFGFSIQFSEGIAFRLSSFLTAESPPV